MSEGGDISKDEKKKCRREREDRKRGRGLGGGGGGRKEISRNEEVGRWWGILRSKVVVECQRMGEIGGRGREE